MAKTLFKIHPLLIGTLRKRLDSVGMVRDKFLDRLLAREIEMLNVEVQQVSSPIAKKFIASSLDNIGLKSVNLALSDATVKRINEVCADKNVPRDAFVNRVILFLLAPKPDLYNDIYPWSDVFGLSFQLLWWEHFDEIEELGAFSEFAEPRCRKTSWDIRDGLVAGLFPVVDDLLATDPFLPYRILVEWSKKRDEVGEYPPDPLHRYLLEGYRGFPNTFGFNCFLSDDDYERVSTLDGFNLD